MLVLPLPAGRGGEVERCSRGGRVCHPLAARCGSASSFRAPCGVTKRATTATVQRTSRSSFPPMAYRQPASAIPPDRMAIGQPLCSVPNGSSPTVGLQAVPGVSSSIWRWSMKNWIVFSCLVKGPPCKITGLGCILFPSDTSL
jgi:hypothetical protein